jgi:hypothetical protein
MKRITIALLLLLSLISTGCATQREYILNSSAWGILNWFDGDSGMTPIENYSYTDTDA